MPDFLETMEQSTVADAARSAPQPVVKAGPVDWFQFRRRHPDLGIAKTGEDGGLEDWQALLRSEGQDRLTTAILKCRSTGRKGDRIWFARVLEALAVDSSHNSPDDGKSDVEMAKAASRSRIDLLIWCITHSARCYADALYPWTPLPEDDTAPVRTPFGRVKRVPMADPLTPERRERVEAMATKARLELLTQCGFPDEKRYNGALYDAVRNTTRLTAWLRSQRLIPSTKEKPHEDILEPGR